MGNYIDVIFSFYVKIIHNKRDNVFITFKIIQKNTKNILVPINKVKLEVMKK